MKVQEEAPVVVSIEDKMVWEKELDDLFRSLREQPKEEVEIVGITSDLTHSCSLHTQELKKKVSKKGWE